MQGDRLSTEVAPPRILVVDDSPVVRRLLAGLLAGPSLRAEVVEASSGLQALRMVMSGTFDCVLCDMNMPGTDGLFFLRAVRAHHSRMMLPVLLLTALDSVVDKVAGFRAGASDYLTKPCEPEELLARVETHVFLARAARHLEHSANTDPLTGLNNRRTFTERLRMEHARTVRTGAPYAVVMGDIDRFKRINDTHGHATGDKVLMAVAELIRSSHRSYDTSARLGGEEFAVLLPGSTCTDAVVVAERIRHAVEAAAISVLPVGGVTISLGVAAHSTETPYAPDMVVELSDRRLYRAKNSGRNCVCAEGAEHGTPDEATVTPLQSATTLVPPAVNSLTDEAPQRSSA